MNLSVEVRPLGIHIQSEITSMLIHGRGTNGCPLASAHMHTRTPTHTQTHTHTHTHTHTRMHALMDADTGAGAGAGRDHARAHTRVTMNPFLTLCALGINVLSPAFKSNLRVGPAFPSRASRRATAFGIQRRLIDGGKSTASTLMSILEMWSDVH